MSTRLTRSSNLKFILFTIIFLTTLLFAVLELILYMTNYNSSYDKMQRFSMKKADWWTCDSISGPRYVKNKVDKSDSAWFAKQDVSWYYDRLRIINSQGYHDREDFNELSSSSDTSKVLFVGDSFTWGASSDVDSSYVDIFTNDIKKEVTSVIWNTGIPATGTNFDLFITKKYLPLQKSNFVILGFCTFNDFSDNLIPYNRLFFTEKASCFNLYDYDENLVPFEISKREAYKRTTGSYPIEELNWIQKIAIRSRVISLIKEVTKRGYNKLNGLNAKRKELEYKLTKSNLNQLNNYIKNNNAELIVLLIPAKDDINIKGDNYLRSIKILNELGITYFENIKLLSDTNYNQNKYDGHWNNSGHSIVGHALSKYFLNYIKTKKDIDLK